jgi:hypothetical protein
MDMAEALIYADRVVPWVGESLKHLLLNILIYGGFISRSLLRETSYEPLDTPLHAEEKFIILYS